MLVKTSRENQKLLDFEIRNISFTHDMQHDSTPNKENQRRSPGRNGRMITPVQVIEIHRRRNAGNCGDIKNKSKYHSDFLGFVLFSHIKEILSDWGKGNMQDIVA